MSEDEKNSQACAVDAEERRLDDTYVMGTYARLGVEYLSPDSPGRRTGRRNGLFAFFVVRCRPVSGKERCRRKNCGQE